MKIIENYKKKIEELKERSNIDIVWNNNLDKISDLSHIKLILCADNPGLYEFQDKVYRYRKRRSSKYCHLHRRSIQGQENCYQLC